MNLKGMIVSLTTVMLVVTMFASSAMAITVDGNGSDWDPVWMLGTSPLDPYEDIPLKIGPNTTIDVTIYGYDLKDVWQHYDSGTNTMHWRCDVWWEVPGDLDGDGNPDGPQSSGDYGGVGQHEQYTVRINHGTSDLLRLTLTNNSVETWPSGMPADAKEGCAPIPNASRCIEFSLSNATDYMDPGDYTLYGSAGGSLDDPGEDWFDAVFHVGPCESNFTSEQSCCKRMQFTGTSTGDMVNHTWDFGGSGTADAPLTRSGCPEDSPPINHIYDSCGTYRVTLSGWCNSGLLRYTETSKDIYVNCGPDAEATASPAKIEVNTPTQVKFDGSKSYPASTPAWAPPAPAIATYEWSFSDGTSAIGDIAYKTVTLGPQGALSATLTVNDSHCEDDVTVYVTTRPKPPQAVPILTLPGVLALIGMMCIVGAGRILTRGRRS